MPHTENGRVVETATEARAAKPVRGMRTVLIVSTIGVAVIFALLWMYHFA